jgi:nucleotide-binding universal stress UspA family protein
MKKILVPIDFSSQSIEALRFAVRIANQSRGEVLLLHVIELPVLYDPHTVLEFERAYMKEAKDKALSEFAVLRKKWIPGNIQVSPHVTYGGTVDGIRHFILKKKPDLVVMGTQGASGLKDFTIGSNVEKIVRSSPVPVIATKKTPESIKNIVVPVSPDFDQGKWIAKLKGIQGLFKAKIHLVYVNTPATFKVDMGSRHYLQAIARKYKLRRYTTTVFNDLSEEEGIIHFAEEMKADLIAMRTHGRRGIMHFALGSIAEGVVNHIPCPVWTFRVK